MKIWNFLAGMLLRIFAAIAVGVLLLTLVYAIPTQTIDRNVARSATVIETEGAYPELTHLATSYLDNWTDSIMLLEAAWSGPEPTLEKALQAYRVGSGEDIPSESLVRYYRDGVYDRRVSYPQYWHGYQTLLKPLLLLTDYSHIRILNGLMQQLLALTVALLLWRRGLGVYIPAWLVSIAMLMPWALAKSLQYSSCFYLMSIGALGALILDPGQKKQALYGLLWLGIATAYFDFLTYPIVTFAIPVTVWQMRQSVTRAWETLRRFLIRLLVWGSGYGLMWVGKIAAGTLLTEADHIGAAADHMTRWFGGEHWFSVCYVFYFNVRDFVYTPVSFAAMLLMAVLLYHFFRRSPGKALKSPVFWETALSYGLICLLPFAWYLVLWNPSGLHHFFTNKSCEAAAFGGLCFLTRVSRLEP